MKLFVQPDDGVTPIIKAINSAKSSIDILIFRFDRGELERALASAVQRGVKVHALIAHTNRSGEGNLRKLELALLAQGITVSRTADELARYHGKMMIVDRRDLYVLGFNYTYVDIERSRSFGICTANTTLVQEAVRLFEADAARRPYEPKLSNFIVSPSNSRTELTAFIKGAQSQLLIYDPTISDRAMIQLLEDRVKAGVDVRILGRLTRSSKLTVRKPAKRLHVRAMVRDKGRAFVGSQSLRRIELEERREVGITFGDPRVVNKIAATFEEDWELAETSNAEEKAETGAATRAAKKVAKAVVKELPPMAPVLKLVIRELTGDNAAIDHLTTEEVEDSIKDAVKAAVKEAVEDVVEGAVEQEALDHEPVEEKEAEKEPVA